jgi:ferritin-like metal-binding protein YciE
MKASSKKNKGKSKTKQTSKESLETIFNDLMKDIYWAEKKLTTALPKMAKAASNSELRKGFEQHLTETKEQVKKIEQCFKILNKKPVAKKCEAMAGLVKEGEEVIKDHDKGNARDAGLIAAAQKVEHYEISAYGTLRTMAKVLGKSNCATLFEEIKDQEAETDEKLTELAESINQLAATDK